jgi:hypothetical protein
VLLSVVFCLDLRYFLFSSLVPLPRVFAFIYLVRACTRANWHSGHKIKGIEEATDEEVGPTATLKQSVPSWLEAKKTQLPRDSQASGGGESVQENPNGIGLYSYLTLLLGVKELKSATTIKSQVGYKNFEDISDNAGIWRVKAFNAPLELPIYAH